MKKKIFAFISILFLLSPLIVSANGGTTQIQNPLKCDTVSCLFVGIIRILLGLVGVFSLFVFMWGGFLMLTSAGNAEQVKKAKDALLWSSIGLATVLASWAIIQYFLKSVISITN